MPFIILKRVQNFQWAVDFPPTFCDQEVFNETDFAKIPNCKSFVWKSTKYVLQYKLRIVCCKYPVQQWSFLQYDDFQYGNFKWAQLWYGNLLLIHPPIA